VNPAAFALPAQGTPGNEAKAVFRGPGRNNFDVTLAKNFKLNERFKAQFRAEAYNIFNHTQFTTEDTTLKLNNTANSVKVTYLGNSYNVAPGGQIPTTFGQFTAAALARRMQLAFRVDF